jgi:cell division protein FtsB
MAANSADSKPKLVAVDDSGGRGARTAPSAAEPRRGGASRRLFWLAVAIAAIALGAFAMQTERVATQGARIEALSQQVEGLQADLAAANARVQTYEMHAALVRSKLGDVIEQLDMLQELVRADPLLPAAPPAQPGASAPPAAGAPQGP